MTETQTSPLIELDDPFVCPPSPYNTLEETITMVQKSIEDNRSGKALKEFVETIQSEPQFNYDLERMEEALKGPFYTVPDNQTFEGFIQWNQDIIDGKILPDKFHIDEIT